MIIYIKVLCKLWGIILESAAISQVFAYSGLPDTNIQFFLTLIYRFLLFFLTSFISAPPSIFCLCSLKIRAITAFSQNHAGFFNCLSLPFPWDLVWIGWHLKLWSLRRSFQSHPQIQSPDSNLFHLPTWKIRKLFLIQIQIMSLSLMSSKD